MNRVRISAGFYIQLAIMVLFLPLKWLIAMLLAGVFHEACHMIAIWLCGIRISEWKIGSGAAKLPLPYLTPKQEILCALAGPLGSLLLFLLFPYFPLLAICGVGQGIYNLLPVYPLDGGRVLRILWKCFQKK